jgi:hypothetical protein
VGEHTPRPTQHSPPPTHTNPPGPLRSLAASPEATMGLHADVASGNCASPLWPTSVMSGVLTPHLPLCGREAGRGAHAPGRVR